MYIFTLYEDQKLKYIAIFTLTAAIQTFSQTFAVIYKQTYY